MNKRIFSLLTSLAMVASMASMTVSAAGDTTATEAPASGTGSSTGAVEGYVDKKVFSVTFPTTPTVDFTMDPQGLIVAAGNEQKGVAINMTGTDKSLLFGNDTSTPPDGTFESYSNTSDKITITSLSSMALDVTVNATIDNAAGLTFDDSSFTDGGHLYLALKDAANTETITADGATLKGSIAAVADTNFETTWDGSAYVYGLKSSISDPSTVAEKYEFQLTGSANPDVDWSELTTAAPKVNLVWNVAEHVDPYIPASESMSVAGGDMAVTLDSAAMGDNNATVTSISASIGGRTRELLGNATYCTASGDTYTFTSSVPANTVITFKFSDGRTETITVGA